MSVEDKTRTLLLIGIDLCDAYSQISYYDFELQDAKSISTAIGEEKFQIPTVIFKKADSEKWYIGEEALRTSIKSEGVLIPKLMEVCRENALIDIEGVKYKPSQLLSIYFKRMLGLLNYEGIKEQEHGVITVTHAGTDKVLLHSIKEAIKQLALPDIKLFIEEHKESFFHYTLSLPGELYHNDVVLIEYEQNHWKCYKLSVNKRTIPHLVQIEESNFTSLLSYGEGSVAHLSREQKQEMDEAFFEQCFALFKDWKVSTVFLVGGSLELDWMNKSLRFLCNGRRVFQGRNLYSKGACYASYLETKKEKVNYLYFNHNKIKYNIGLTIQKKNRPVYHSLLSAGINWYEARGECELLLDSVDDIELEMQTIDKKENRFVILPLSNLPERPNKTIRLKLVIMFESEAKATVSVTDLGFGEFYRSTLKTWKHDILF